MYFLLQLCTLLSTQCVCMYICRMHLCIQVLINISRFNSLKLVPINNSHFKVINPRTCASRVIVVSLSFYQSFFYSISHSVIFIMQDFSQTTNADGTKLDIKDEDHSLYPLIGYFCHVRSTGLRAYWCGCVHYLGGVFKGASPL